MADLEDINIPSISNMEQDQAIDYLRQIRLQRRTPQKPTVQSIKKKALKATPKMSADQALELLKQLEEGL